MQEHKVIEFSPGAPDADSSDPFDRLEELLVDQQADERAGSQKKQVSVAVGRPPKTMFFRVAPDWRATAEFLEVEGERRVLYMVMPGVLRNLVDECKLTVVVATLRLYVSRDGDIGLWPLRVGADAMDNRYNESARLAAELAETTWVRLKSNQTERCYEPFVAVNQAAFGEPQFPDPSRSRNEILRLAFKERLITSVDHPAVRALLGAV